MHAGAQPPFGYTLLRVRDGLSRFRQTDVPPVAVALSNAGDALAAVVAASPSHDAELHVLDVATLDASVVALPASPRGVGFVGDTQTAFAEVDHPDGR